MDKNYMAIFDLADFFRQIHLPEIDSDFLGYALFGLRFRDRKQGYGISSAPGNCQYFATILIWIFNHCKLKERYPHLMNNTLVHVDDFMLAAKSEPDCILMETIFEELFTELNVDVSHHKTIHTTQEAELYGLYWNLKNKTISIPNKKFKQLKNFILLVIKYRILSGAALESLSVINDLRFWLKYAEFLRSVPMAHIAGNPSINVYAATDACQIGAGFVVDLAKLLNYILIILLVSTQCVENGLLPIQL